MDTARVLYFFKSKGNTHCWIGPTPPYPAGHPTGSTALHMQHNKDTRKAEIGVVAVAQMSESQEVDSASRPEKRREQT